MIYAYGVNRKEYFKRVITIICEEGIVMGKLLKEITKTKKVVLVLFGLLVFTMFSTTSTIASTVKFTIDNDDTTHRNYETGYWEKLTVGNYGDSRIYRGSGDASYYWVINPGNYSSSLMWYVYLNNASFNNPYASYYANAKHISDIDQNYAPSWTQLYPAVTFQPSVDNYFQVRTLYSPSNKNTGADTINFRY